MWARVGGRFLPSLFLCGELSAQTIQFWCGLGNHLMGDSRDHDHFGIPYTFTQQLPIGVNASIFCPVHEKGGQSNLGKSLGTVVGMTCLIEVTQGGRVGQRGVLDPSLLQLWVIDMR